jgi:chemotaxis protein MotB
MEQQPIVVKRIKKAAHGHHGGSWKVAFADFVTAMMAFFLLMWLMGSTTEAQRTAIQSYFQDPTGVAGPGGPDTGARIGPGGASTSMIPLGGGGELRRHEGTELHEQVPSEQRIEQLAQEQERKRLETLMKDLEEAIAESQALKPFKDQLLLDITPEGLRIQIVDKENRPMFDIGSGELKWYTAEILQELAQFINEAPNQISISGHTDATPYVRQDYTNWELSTDRANAARRALVAGGMSPDKVDRVLGLASSVLFDRERPYSPVNRRISIVVLNKEAAEAHRREEAAIQAPDLPETITQSPSASGL